MITSIKIITNISSIGICVDIMNIMVSIIISSSSSSGGTIIIAITMTTIVITTLIVTIMPRVSPRSSVQYTS